MNTRWWLGTLSFHAGMDNWTCGNKHQPSLTLASFMLTGPVGYSPHLNLGPFHCLGGWSSWTVNSGNRWFYEAVALIMEHEPRALNPDNSPSVWCGCLLPFLVYVEPQFFLGVCKNAPFAVNLTAWPSYWIAGYAFLVTVCSPNLGHHSKYQGIITVCGPKLGPPHLGPGNRMQKTWPSCVLVLFLMLADDPNLHWV